MKNCISIASANNNLINYLGIELTQQLIAHKVEKNDLSLFKTILEKSSNILVIDDNFQSGVDSELAKLVLINPRLIIIYLSSVNSEIQRINFLKIGIERVIPKPVNNIEVMAHIEAVIKSIERNLVATSDNLDYVKQLDKNAWILVRKGCKLIAPNQVSVDLRLREYKLLNQLFLSPGEVICKNQLVEDIIGKNIYNSYEKLNKIISELRKKILANVNLALPIKTIHTIGYAFNSEAVIDG